MGVLDINSLFSFDSQILNEVRSNSYWSCWFTCSSPHSFYKIVKSVYCLQLKLKPIPRFWFSFSVFLLHWSMNAFIKENLHGGRYVWLLRCFRTNWPLDTVFTCSTDCFWKLSNSTNHRFKVDLKTQVWKISVLNNLGWYSKNNKILSFINAEHIAIMVI